MIPKIIHYCWFGPKKLSSMEERCLASWKKQCPDYEIRKWTEKDFDFSTNSYAREAQAHQAWAFLSDYARNLILAEHGGIYLDTDVELCRPLDPLLNQDGFCGVEENKIASGLALGAVAHHPIIEALVNLYDNLHFILPDGQKNMSTNTELQHQVFERFGFSTAKSKTIQTFSGMTAYPPEYFCPKSFRDGSMHKTANTFSIHHYHASWASPVSRIGYYLRRLAGEKTYLIVQKLFHNPGKLIVLWCLLLVSCQNLRGVLHAASLNNGIFGKSLTVLMILLTGSVIGIQVLRRKMDRRWLLALALSIVIFAASPWNSMLLWMFLLGGVVACFPFRLFAACNIISLSCILLCWSLLLLWGVIPSDSVSVKKIIWMNFYNFGFNSPNIISMFLFQLAAYAYWFIRNRKWQVFALIPLAVDVFLTSGGRCYAIGITVIAVIHFLPQWLNRFFIKRIGLIAGGCMLLSLLLGYAAPPWHFLYLIMNERVNIWHIYLVQDSSAKSFFCGRIWNKKTPDPVFLVQAREKRFTAEWEKIPDNMTIEKIEVPDLTADTGKVLKPKIIPLDNAFLQLFINTGILGVCTFFWLMSLAIKKHRGMLFRLFPVFGAMLFCGLFESHVFGASMLGLLPVYFFFRRKGRC